MVRPTSTPPAGVVSQNTGQPMGASEILTATLQLGNSSAVRKRVTVVIHDSDFSDLAACTFWLPPSQTLSSYTVRLYTSKAWSDVSFSTYAATIGPESWIQLDNVVLQRTPGAPLTGTHCVEPGGIVP